MSEMTASAWDCHVHVFDATVSGLQGHYPLTHRPLREIESVAQTHGVGHLVLVQPSVYGVDNSVMLQALGTSAGRHRGVVVVDATVTDAVLDHMHQLGVRGVRFNLVSPVGNDAQALRKLAPRLQARGWHVQWYARPHELAHIADLHEANGLVCVLDHLAGMHAGLAEADPSWQSLQRLADCGAWIKLSGWYRLQTQAPYDALRTHVLKLSTLFGERVVWGSDWPHTFFAPDALPGYEQVLQPVAEILGQDAAHRVQKAGGRLYA